MTAPGTTEQTLANLIRTLDGGHNLGAGELAELLVNHGVTLAGGPALPGSPEALSPERIQELLDVEQEHKAMLELRLNDYTLKPGTMDLSLNGEPARMFAAGVVSLFRDNGAENNFEVQVDLRDPASPHERYLLLIQRLHRPTPAEQRAVAQAEAETLRQEIKLYRGDPYSMDRDDPNYREGLEATGSSLADDLQGMSAFGALVPFARGRARAAANLLRAQDEEMERLRVVAEAAAEVLALAGPFPSTHVALFNENWGVQPSVGANIRLHDLQDALNALAPTQAAQG